MSGKIYLIQEDGNLKEMNEELYESEGLLQDLLEKYPNLIDGDQINRSSPRKWLFLGREKAVPSSEDSSGRWAVDHLFVDQDAIPTIIEVKRSTDTRIRREVVGQMLEYAANAVSYWKPEDLKNEFEKECTQRTVDPVDELRSSLGTETEYDTFWDSVTINLKTGKIRMLFVADTIPDELQRIIEFLNEQMEQSEVLGVEIKQYTSQGLKTLVPRVVGQTAEAQAKRKGVLQTRQWDEASFFEDLRSRHDVGVEQTARTIYEWAQSHADCIWFGKGKNNGSFVPIVTNKGTDHQAFAVYTYGTVEIYFYWYMYKPPFDSIEKRKELMKRLNAIEGVQISESRIDKRPGIQLTALAGKKVKQFLEVYDWYLDEIKSL